LEIGDKFQYAEDLGWQKPIDVIGKKGDAKGIQESVHAIGFEYESGSIPRAVKPLSARIGLKYIFLVAQSAFWRTFKSRNVDKRKRWVLLAITLKAIKASNTLGPIRVFRPPQQGPMCGGHLRGW
jgi:hypothetical protein